MTKIIVHRTATINDPTYKHSNRANIGANKQIIHFTETYEVDSDGDDIITSESDLMLLYKLGKSFDLNLIFTTYIRSLVTCKLCRKVFDDPIALPCSNYVCRKHLDVMGKNACVFCDQRHNIKILKLMESDERLTNLIALGHHKTDKKKRLELIKKRFSKCIGVFFLLMAIYWFFFY
jgi:hypothetical protein